MNADLLGVPIRLTRQMIRDGYRGDCKHCPITLAVLGVAPGRNVHADIDYITVDDVRYKTPERVSKFMNRFDYCTTKKWISGFTFTFSRAIERSGVPNYVSP